MCCILLDWWHQETRNYWLIVSLTVTLGIVLGVLSPFHPWWSFTSASHFIFCESLMMIAYTHYFIRDCKIVIFFTSSSFISWNTSIKTKKKEIFSQSPIWFLWGIVHIGNQNKCLTLSFVGFQSDEVSSKVDYEDIPLSPLAVSRDSWI